MEVFTYMVTDAGSLKRDLFAFWDKIALFRVSVFGVFFRNQLRPLEQEHQELMCRWRSIREQATRMDALISPGDPDYDRKLGQILAQPAVMQSIRETDADVSSIMRDLVTILSGLRIEQDRKRSSSLQVVTILIAAAAVVVTVVISLF